MGNIPHFLPILLFYLVQIQSRILPVFHTLLNKMETCDIRILHDHPNQTVDWININVPLKIVYTPEKKEPLPLDVFKSRGLNSCK